MTVQNITVLGATGSIGRSTLDVIARHPDRYRVFALTANSQVDLLLAQCRQFRPQFAVMANAAAATRLQQLRSEGVATEVLAGSEGLIDVASASEVDTVMAAIVGAAGLLPSLAAVKTGKKVLLANKESLVMSGHLFMQAVHQHGATLLPIDSEHNAIFQSLPSNYSSCAERGGVRRILLTASGGPFRTTDPSELAFVTPEQACAHPNWSMGRKISVDSATMINKALELVEACWLFDLTPEQVEVVIHPQSVIHSLVDYVDGSVLAQLGNPDMRTPIAYGLAWPERIESGVSPLDLFEVGRLDFEKPCDKRFPALSLIRQAVNAGGTATAILNAANEVAVEAFLQQQIGFTDITALIDRVLQAADIGQADDIDKVLAADCWARECANRMITK